MDTKPSQLQLKRFPLGNGDYTNIYQRIGVHYKTFGTFLLNDKDGGKVNNAESKRECCPVKMCERIVVEWLSRGTDVTWAFFVECLRCVELNLLAEDIECALQDQGAKPNICTLRGFVGKTGKVFDVIERIGVDCRNFGTFLLNDSEGHKVRNIAAAEHSPANICEKIVNEWCAGKGKMPVTWGIFIRCLRSTNLNVLADDIEGALQKQGVPAMKSSATLKVDISPAKVEGESPAKVEGESPAKVEGESPAKVEGESPAKVEGESPAKVEGESPAKVEGESPAKVEGERPAKVEGESPESKTIRTNLTKITQVLSAVVDPTWFAQKLEEVALMADASSRLVPGKTDKENVSTFLNAVKAQVNTSRRPRDEFAKFMKIFQSQPSLENLLQLLLEEHKLNGGNAEALWKQLTP